MSDEIYKPDSDEYQFNDNEAAVVYKAEKKSFIQAVLAQRRIWLAIAIIVIVIVGYKLSDIFTYKADKTLQKPAALPQLGQSLSEQPAKLTSLKAQLPAASAESTLSLGVAKNNPALNDGRLTKLEQHNQENTASLSRVESRLNGINSDFSLLRDQLNQLKDELRTVNAQLNGLQQRLAKPTEQKKAVNAKPKNQKSTVALVSRPSYHVQAVLPGRAWLVSDDGSATITVAVGDALPGYGNIVSINPNRASVITSTGYTIPYKPD